MTSFYKVYERFLSKITDDQYLELTPRDTFCDLRELLIDSIPGFEFPRFKVDYTLNDYDSSSHVGTKYDLMGNGNPEDIASLDDVLLESECSTFNVDLTDEEINIFALLMVEAWVDRQLASIEVTRMKYSGSDFKMTSQANHLSKLLSLKTEVRREAHHMQRLYRRRRCNSDGHIESNWSVLREVNALDY